MALRSDRLDAIVSLSKRRGFVYPSSEIYGGLRAAWDYGPLGVELKNNIKRQWWRSMVTERDEIVGLDSSVILAREVWEASGHVTEFVDPLTECTVCHKRYRADQLIEAYEEKHGHAPAEGLKDIACPNCGTRGQFTEPRMFNGLLRTHLGPTEDESGLAYLRPETAQGIFINFKNVLQTSRKKIPFGIGQIGKSFRNEITPGNFIFRTREFEQMEMEFFVQPGTDEEWHETWIRTRFAWYLDLGIREENLRLYEHPKEKLSHYSKRTVDIEYKFDFAGSEWGELEGIANRTDYDLTTHAQASGQDLSFLDQESGERYVPYVIEPAAGVDRGALVFLLDAYAEDEAPDAKGKLEKRTVLRLDPRLAPVKVAVLPLSRNADLSPKARDLAAALRKHWNTDFDDASAIGRRYRRQDEIGTPYCVTVDFDTLNDQAVTVRDRDSMRQERVGLDYKALPRDLNNGDLLLLNDGLIVLIVDKVVGHEIFTTVKIGGELSNNKGINRQGGGLTAPALTAKDMEDIKTAMSFQADYLAISFPKSATDMEMARQLANIAGEPYGHKPMMIAKIERAEASPVLQEILDASDGIMVARGDLAVEVGNAAVPALQKRMIRMARESNKLTITATQMTNSVTPIALPNPTLMRLMPKLYR